MGSSLYIFHIALFALTKFQQQMSKQKLILIEIIFKNLRDFIILN